MAQAYQDSHGNTLTTLPGGTAFTVTLAVTDANSGRRSEVTLDADQLRQLASFLALHADFAERFRH